MYYWIINPEAPVQATIWVRCGVKPFWRRFHSSEEVLTVYCHYRFERGEDFFRKLRKLLVITSGKPSIYIHKYHH